MGVMKRFGNLFRKPEEPHKERGILDLGPGDFVDISLTTYQVTGKVRNTHRNAVMLTVQDGADIRYLYVEAREKPDYEWYSPIDGRMDNLEEVPTTMTLDDRAYYLEEQFSGRVVTEGQTPFLQSGEQMVWQYQSDDRRLLRIEWQDGRYMFYEGEFLLKAEVDVIHGARD